jgi:SAM-dependent methyltransferase
MSTYTGYENLEAMAIAVNYNNYLFSLILTCMKTERELKVLDIGAGIGTFAKKVRDKGYDVLCYEPDPGQSEIMKAKGLRVTRCLDDVTPASLDLIYSLNVLEHIENDTQALLQWLLLLKPGGRMLIYVPAFQFLFSSMDRKVGHFRRYRKSELVKKSSVAGYKIVRAEYADSIGFFASIAYKYLNNSSGDINQKALQIYDRFIFPISKALDLVMHSMLGKNVFLIIERDNY